MLLPHLRTIIGLAVTAVTVAALVIAFFLERRPLSLPAVRMARPRRARRRRVDAFPRGCAGAHLFHAHRLERLPPDRRRCCPRAHRPLASCTTPHASFCAWRSSRFRSGSFSRPITYGSKIGRTLVCPITGPPPCSAYGWSFATIVPAIFETSDLVQALLPPIPIQPLDDLSVELRTR